MRPCIGLMTLPEDPRGPEDLVPRRPLGPLVATMRSAPDSRPPVNRGTVYHRPPDGDAGEVEEFLYPTRGMPRGEEVGVAQDRQTSGDGRGDPLDLRLVE